MNPLPLLFLAALVAVPVILVLGLLNMAKGNDPARSNRLMQWRVVMQAIAIGLLMIIALAARHG